jgi:hypothetical protein
LGRVNFVPFFQHAAQQTQASITRLSNAWDKFKDSMFNSSFVIGATDFGTKALNRLAGGYRLGGEGYCAR